MWKPREDPTFVSSYRNVSIVYVRMTITKSTLRLCAARCFIALRYRPGRLRMLSTVPDRTVLGRYLLVTNTVVGGVLMGTGDVLQQRIKSYRASEKFDPNWSRTQNMVVIGCVLGLGQHVFYKILDHFVSGKNLKAVATKMALDLAIASPLVIVVFIFGIGLLERRSAEEMRNEMWDKALPIFILDCVIWPPIQYVNFTYLPIRYRVIYVNIMMIIYDVFLSYIKYEYNPRKKIQ